MDEPVRKWQSSVNRVVVAPAVPRPRDVPGVDELVDDAVRRAFSDSDPLADLAEPDTGIFGDAEKDAGMVGEKRP